MNTRFMAGLLSVFLLLSAQGVGHHASIAAKAATSGKQNALQWHLGRIGATQLWTSLYGVKPTGSGSTSLSVKVAIVDSGVDRSHPDLKGKILSSEGYNFVGNNKDTSDELGHGTQLAGIIAAIGRGKDGVRGVAGNSNVKILPVKVLDKLGNGGSGTVAKGIEYAVDMGAAVINVSISFKTHDRLIRSALRYAQERGVLVVVAAGNSASDCDSYSPAGDPGVLTVASVGKSGKPSPFSSYGASVAMAAPGEEILTTAPGGKYVTVEGTSMSAPMVSAAAALLKLANPLLNGQALTKILTATASDLGPKGKDQLTGSGLLNLPKALSMAVANKN